MPHRLKELLLLSSSLLITLPALATPPGFNKTGTEGVAMRQTESAARNMQGWWPEVVDLARLVQNGYNADPNGPNFDYRAKFAKLDLKAVKTDINKPLR
jgi:catalase-peroxidase